MLHLGTQTPEANRFGRRDQESEGQVGLLFN